jgi:hypothetical protein
MIIPVMSLGIREGNIVSSEITFSGTSVSMTANTIGYRDLMPSLSDVCDKDVPVLAIDTDGMKKNDITHGLLRKMKIKREFWLMTGIRNAGDVMDAFHSDADKIVIPYHMTSDTHLSEMIEISDSCIPALFADDSGVRTKGKRKDLGTCVRMLESMNFKKILVFDVSGGDGKDVYAAVKDHGDRVIPYAGSGETDDVSSLQEMGFADVMVSAVKLFRNISRRSDVRS